MSFWQRPSPGDEVWLREPQAYAPGCNSIIGTYTAPLVDGGMLIDAEVTYPWRAGPGGACSLPITLLLDAAAAKTVWRRSFGTPISQLSGRPGHAGFGEFCRIAESWGRG